MPETDHPLKELILSFREAFVAWLLSSQPQQVRPLNVELLASARRSDLVFEVIQADGQMVLLHIELQGRRSSEPMPLRMLDYMSRLIQREELVGQGIRLTSVVLYLGRGAGRGDTGGYEVLGVDGQMSLGWRYEPIRLWEIEAETLLALDEPALLALIGQVSLREPEQEIGQAVAGIRRVADERQRGRLLTALVSLLSNEEVLTMVEQMLDAADEMLLDLPYLRRLREQARAEGIAQGQAEGKEAGLAEGKEAGLAEGVLAGMREAILETVALRFNPPAMDYRQLGERLEGIRDRKRLQQVLAAAIQAEDMAAFMASLSERLADT